MTAEDMGGMTAHNPGDAAAVYKVVLLPELVLDGVEEVRADILRPYAAHYLDALTVATAEEAALRDQAPRVGDFTDIDDYVAQESVWRAANPSPTAQLESTVNEQLGITPQNNLRIILSMNSDGTPVLNSPVIRKYVDLLTERHPQFVAACRVAFDAWTASRQHEVNLMRTGRDLSREEAVEGILLNWNVHMYMTEMAARLRELGATDEEMTRLRN